MTEINQKKRRHNKATDRIKKTELTGKSKPIAALAGLMLLLLLSIGAYGSVQAEATAVAASPQWSSGVTLSTTSSNGAYNPRLVMAPNGTLIVVYSHRLGNGTNDPYYRRSSNHGLSWSSPAPIHSSSSADSVQVTLAFSPTSIAHAVWIEAGNLVHAAQSDWPANTRHTIATAGSNLILTPSLAIAPNGHLHVAWSQTTETSIRKIYYSRSTNGGASWTAPVELADAQQDSQAPSLAIDQNGNIHVAWEEPSLYVDPPNPPVASAVIQYRKGTVSGGSVSWNPPTSQPGQVISTAPNVIKARRPVIFTQGNDIHLSFAREASSGEQYAYYSRYTSGSGWSTPVDTTLNTPIGVNTADPFFLITTAVACNSTVYVYYHGTYVPSGNESIWGANSLPGWSPRDRATKGTTRTINPSIGCTPGNNMLHLAYERIETGTGKHTIVYSRGLPKTIFLPIIRK